MPTAISPPNLILNSAPQPNRKRWKRKECEELERTGFLPEPYELINGEIYEKRTVDPPHSITLMLMAAWFEQLFGRLFVRTQDPINLKDQENKPEPDIVVLRREVTAYALEHPGPDDIILIAEISDSTIVFDLNVKSSIYARAGIKEYWVCDIPNRRIVIHQDPSQTGYQKINSYQESENIFALTHPDVLVKVSDLLPGRT